MLFNSYEFLFGFMPLVMGGFFALVAFGMRRLACSWLTLASVFFYGYWAPQYMVLLVGSIAFNFLLSQPISWCAEKGNMAGARRLMIFAVAVNLLTLAYFKYANFFIDTVNTLSGSPLPALDVVLPIGISFFTFTQIAFLVDCYEGKVNEPDFLYYLLFVTYFPHLIAGPVLHHAEMMPQFSSRDTYRWQTRNISIGLIFFSIGLFKKVVLADGIQPYVGPVFDHGTPPDLITAWGAALAYTLQLYFDFSGYSDMAIGLSKLFNVDLPINFNSPYRSKNISEFWRRWHMTLSRFLRDYLYVRMGGNRHGQFRRYANLMATMLLGGLWHGAGWTFVVWGGLHGLFLVINHGWQKLFPAKPGEPASLHGRLLAQIVTFGAVVVAWVFFRAHTFDDAVRVIAGMAGANGWTPGDGSAIDTRQWFWIAFSMSIVWFLPNSQEIVRRWVAPGATAVKVALADRFHVRWLGVGASLSLVLLLAVINGSRGVSEFIYFNF